METTEWSEGILVTEERRGRQRHDPTGPGSRASEGAEARDDDCTLTAALGNPLRVHILSEIDRGPTGPGRVAAQCGEPGAKIAYHFKVLLECGCIEPVAKGSRQPRGERLYRRAKPPRQRIT